MIQNYLKYVELYLHFHAFLFQMCVIFNEKGLKNVQPPCVAQMFINHNAILYKVFVIGQQQYITERPSLKNFHSEGMATKSHWIISVQVIFLIDLEIF